MTALLQRGRSPADAARESGVALSVAFGHSDALIASGKLRRSDVFYSIPPKRRRLLARILGRDAATGFNAEERQLLEFGQADAKTVARYSLPDAFLGDLYEDVRIMEIALHGHVCSALATFLGKTSWWARVPEKMRAECERRRSKDRPPADSLARYLGLADLTVLVGEHWRIMHSLFPRTQPQVMTLAELHRLTAIRNWVMHPARGRTPTEADFEFVRRIRGYAGFAT